MSVTLNGAKPLAKPKRGPAPGGMHLGRQHTPEARRIAAALLEVLAGGRTPTEAAQVLGFSVPRYYQVERRALESFLDGCESRPRGPGRSLGKELAVLRRDHQRLQRELVRLQSLLRAAQRTLGLTPPAPTPAKKNGKKLRKQRTARALSVATRLQQATDVDAQPTASVSTEGNHQE